MRKFIDIKEKSLFIPVGLHSITISDVIDYILKAYSTSSSLKKKRENFRRKKGKRDENKKKEGEGKERGGKEEKKKKGMERVCSEGK